MFHNNELNNEHLNIEQGNFVIIFFKITNRFCIVYVLYNIINTIVVWLGVITLWVTEQKLRVINIKIITCFFLRRKQF